MENSKIVDFNPATPEVEPVIRTIKPENNRKKTVQDYEKMVKPEIMANIRKNAEVRARSEAAQNMVHLAIESFLYKWNDNPVNENDQIEFRLTPTSAPADNNQFQFCLALEYKRNGLWTVLARVGRFELPGDERAMTILTTDLYHAMFVEIAHTGLMTTIALREEQALKQYGKTHKDSEIVN